MRFFSSHIAAGTKPSRQLPQEIAALLTRGNLLEDAGRLQEARTVYEEIIDLAPDAFQGYLNLGNVCLLEGIPAQAGDQYRKAIQRNPEHPGSHLNLGNALMLVGDHDKAVGCYRTAAQLEPTWSEAWFGLGCALERLSPLNIEAVDQAYREALRLHPGHGKAAANLAVVLRQNGKTAHAKSLIDGVLAHDPQSVPALLASAVMHKELGDPESSVAAYRQALAVSPEDEIVNNGYLFMLNFIPHITGETILDEHRRYGELLSRKTKRYTLRAAGGAKKRLKIGYVSPDFRKHPVSCFIAPLLQNYNRSEYEIFCYYNHSGGDEITEKFRSMADHWRDVFPLSDDELATSVVADGIDILVDLAGHTAENRLGVFARKPAPVQCTWLGYLCTTGLDAIDYRICDVHTDPAQQAESWQVEKPLRLPDSQWCYAPQISLPASSPLPWLTNGYWTFGSLNQGSKLNAENLRVWGDLLNAIPNSRLRLIGIADSLLAERLRADFATQGISSGRIDVIGRIPIEDYFECYSGIDIALDPFPYNGATTTCDALVSGVPVATVAGSRAVARGGVSLLTTIGLHKWIATSAGDLVSVLSERIRDPMQIAALRVELPKWMRASPLMDGATFTRNLEAAYRNIWGLACAQSH